MNREQAYKAMQQGHKITHEYFSSDEYYELQGDVIKAEDKYDHTKTFWSTEDNNFRADGWELYRSSQVI